jgi:iron complex outermembrane receptor protein
MPVIPKKPVHKFVQSLAAGAVSMVFVPTALQAQQIENPEEEKRAALEEVVVTGTLIRGVEAIGSQTISLDRENIVESGAVTTNELLATVPQVANFFNQRPEQDPRGADRNSLNRPNLRDLPGINSASGGTTLVLVDGHRLTPMGVDQSSLDADVIPGRVIEQVAIVTDGGSSLYGADAVGGVINFVTLNEFEGVELDVGYDTGSDYSGWQANLLAGTKWDSGTGYISIGTTDRDNMENSDHDWAAMGTWNEEGTQLTPDGTECLTPVGAVTTWFWFGSGWTDNPRAPGAGVTPVGDPCDISGASSLLPKQTRDNIYASLVQEITDGVSLNVKTYYMKRNTRYSKYPTGDSIAEPTPTEQGIVGQNTGDLYDTAQVGFSYGVNPGYTHRDQKVDLETYGITPELIVDLHNSWQVRNTFHMGYSDNSFELPSSNRVALLEYVENGEFDPLNIGAADPAVVADITNWESAADTVQELFFVRSIADGDVIELPAGMLRSAVGVEYMQEDAKKRKGETPVGDLSEMRFSKANRDVKSIYGELSIPVLATLDMSISARYDDYSDFGNTSNPNYGISWSPTDWLTIYGKYGESFNAPTLLDSLGTADGRYVFDSASVVPDPNGERTNPSRDDAFILEGASGTLAPQVADITAIGFDLMPLEGLTFNVNYYEIDFKDLLGAPDPQSTDAVLLNPDKFIFEPTQAQLDDLLSQIENSDQFSDANAENLGVIVDRRIDNTEEAKLKGFDVGAQYYHDTQYGSFAYALLGTYQSRFDLTQSGNEVDQLAYTPDFIATANISWSRNNLRARLTFNYTDEYDTDPGVAINQDKVDSFLNTLLFVGYDFDSSSRITEGLSLRFNVDNVFDETPPEYRRNQQLNYSATGFSVGRVFKIGLTKRF